MMKQQSGNALFLVLIAIVLLATLTFTVTRSDDGGGIEDEEAQMVATEMLHYGTSMRQAVGKLRGSNGCAAEEVSFERPPFDGSDEDYTNAYSPSDFRCHVFHSDGGNVSHAKMSEIVKMIDPQNGHAGIYAGSDLAGVGTWGCGTTDCVDVYMVFFVQTPKGKAVCDAYNILLKNDDLIPTPTTVHMLANDSVSYNGTFNSSHAATNTRFTGKKSYCFTYSPDPKATLFVHVLIER